MQYRTITGTDLKHLIELVVGAKIDNILGFVERSETAPFACPLFIVMGIMPGQILRDFFQSLCLIGSCNKSVLIFGGLYQVDTNRGRAYVVRAPNPGRPKGR